jgi:hypothetical protein
MFFKRIEPHPAVKHIIECYWIIEDEEATPKKQKIIPDGFTEIIFHFGDPYRIKLNKQWRLQSKSLVAGQITKHFWLENTGVSNVLGIKLKPTSLTHLYDINMHLLTDKVLAIKKILPREMTSIENAIRKFNNHAERISVIEEYFKNLLWETTLTETAADRAINLIFEKRGMVTIDELPSVSCIGERQL